jgi:hypothetical protein
VILSLFAEGQGTIALPREWTDQASPSPSIAVLPTPPILDALCLIKLRGLVESIGKGVDDVT